MPLAVDGLAMASTGNSGVTWVSTTAPTEGVDDVMHASGCSKQALEVAGEGGGMDEDSGIAPV